MKSVVHNPRISARNLFAQHGISKSTVCRILKDSKMHPYNTSRAQELMSRDFYLTETFCHSMLQQNCTDSCFLSRVLWTDEAKFSTCTIHVGGRLQIRISSRKHIFKKHGA